jgi:hypothetical protein
MFMTLRLKWESISTALLGRYLCSSKLVCYPIVYPGDITLIEFKGVPTIRFVQKHGAANLLTLSTVATFFSAVTATTLQFSYSQTGDMLSDAVNAFWFSSLVFSIAAAVNSLLGLSWKQAM